MTICHFVFCFLTFSIQILTFCNNFLKESKIISCGHVDLQIFSLFTKEERLYSSEKCQVPFPASFTSCTLLSAERKRLKPCAKGGSVFTDFWFDVSIRNCDCLVVVSVIMQKRTWKFLTSGPTSKQSPPVRALTSTPINSVAKRNGWDRKFG